MTTKDEALKLALEALELNCVMSEDGEDLTPVKIKKAIKAIHEALAEQGCDYCNHPQYAGTKCKNCGREQPAQEQSLQDLWHKVWPDAGAFVRVSADDLTQFARAIEAAHGIKGDA